MKLDKHVVWVLARRDLRSYFASPTGYVFITLFILLSAAAAFWQEEFFANNLANLDQLNDLFPLILLFFIPALTMNVWAEERRKGTEELLLTIPASDLEITLGKYLGVVGVYTVSILLSLSHVVVLLWLGRPDLGLMIGNYLGYWLAGAALIGVGMLASLLVTNATLGFILGAVFCSVFVVLGSPLVAFSDTIQGLLRQVGLQDHLFDFTRGVVSLTGIVYFLSLIGVSLYLNVLILGRRHWPQQAGGQRFAMHQLVRVIAVFVALIAGNSVLARPALRLDVTAEQIHGLSGETKEIIRSLDAGHPVLINAYVSPEVPRSLVDIRESLLSTLREIAAVGGGRVQVQVHDVQPYSAEARDARDKYGIAPREMVAQESARSSAFQVYLGVAFACGTRQEVIPFFERGLPVEYELVRSIRVVANAQRKRIGVLTTDVNLFGGFDYENMTQTPPWSVVRELGKQYDVVRVSADAPIKDSLDALVAVMPSTLIQPQLDNLKNYVLGGHPTLLVDDPLPLVKINLSPVLPAGAKSSPFDQGQNEQKQKGDIAGFFKSIGVTWNPMQVVWDTYNPHREILQTPPEVVFVAQTSNNPEAFNEQNEITSGLQEMVLLYPGYIYKAVDSKMDLQPLLRTSHVSGNLRWDQLVQRSFFGMGINRNPQRVPTDESYILAAQVTGNAPTGIDSSSGKKVNCVVIADVDFISEQFLQIRAQGIENLNFDNITFFLNAIDVLAGDHSFVELRKKRVKYRTLESVERQTREFVEKRLQEEKLADADAQRALQEAQSRLDQKVAEVRNRSDLDAQAKQIMAQNLQEVESRRLEVAKANIDDSKQAAVERSKENMESSIRTIQSRIRTLAVIFPPLPVFAAGVFIFVRRRKRERDGAIAARRLRS